MIPLSSASFPEILAELRGRFPAMVLAVQFYQEGYPEKLVTRLHHHAQNGDIMCRSGMAHALVVEMDRVTLVEKQLMPNDEPLDPPSGAGT